MAADSQSEWFYVEQCNQKIFRVNGMLVGVAGQLGDAIKFRNWLKNGGDRPVITEKFSAIVVKNKKVLQYDACLEPMKTEGYAAVGSGACFAIAAMDCGKSAKEALEIARKRDSGTGGRIRMMRIKT